MRELATSPIALLGFTALAPAAVPNLVQVVVASRLDAAALGPDEVAALRLLAGRLAELDSLALVGSSLSAALAASLAVVLVLQPEPARRAVIAATLAGLSAWLAHRAFELSAERALLRMLSDAAFDPAVRARLVGGLGAGDRLGLLLGVVTAGVTCALAVARGRRHLIDLAFAALLALPVALSLPLATAARHGAVHRAGERAARALTVFGIQAPTVTRPTSIAGAPDVIVLASGRALPRRRVRVDGAPHVVYADPSAAFREVFVAVGQEVSRIVLAGAVELPDPALGELGPLVGPRLPGLDVTLARAAMEAAGGDTLDVHMLAGRRGRVTLGRGRREASFATEDEARSALGPLLSSPSTLQPRARLRIRYRPAVDQTAGEVVHDLDILARVLPIDLTRQVEIAL